MKKLIIISSLLFTQFAYSQNCDQHFYNQTKPISQTAEIICKNKFAVGFSKKYKTVMWTSIHLTASNLQNENVSRKDAFKPDPTVSPAYQSQVSAYVGTGYDKGHMVPFEDVADDEVSALESFHMTNIAPQIASHNRGIWKSLEYRTRKMTIQKGQSFVITGPIFKAPTLTLRDGTPIPTAFFKIILIPTTKESYVFIIPNKTGLLAGSLPNYLTTLKKLNAYNTNTTINFKTPLNEKLTFN